MTAPVARARSNRRLVLLLALFVLTPVALVLGPFRRQFFPEHTRQLQSLAILEVPPLDVARLAGPGWSAAEIEELRREYEAHAWPSLVARLDREPRDRMNAGLKYLFGIAALLDRRSTVAAKGLADAGQEGDAALRAEASFALAQALLLTGNAGAAEAELTPIAAGDGPHKDAAARQLRELSALR
jgi:hypothetical protein